MAVDRLVVVRFQKLVQISADLSQENTFLSSKPVYAEKKLILMQFCKFNSKRKLTCMFGIEAAQNDGAPENISAFLCRENELKSSLISVWTP